MLVGTSPTRLGALDVDDPTLSSPLGVPADRCRGAVLRLVRYLPNAITVSGTGTAPCIIESSNGVDACDLAMWATYPPGNIGVGDPAIGRNKAHKS